MPEPLSDTSELSFVDELFAIQRELSFRDPMLDAVKQRTIKISGLRLWTLQASLVVREFTRFISAIHANCPYRDVQALLAENLWEEHGKGSSSRDHYSLIRKLTRSLGANDEELDHALPIPATAEYINHCLQVTRNLSFIESMTAIALGIEFYMPVFFGSFAEALRSNYGSRKSDLEYLLVHVTEDELHSRRVVQLLRSYANTPEIQERAKNALREMLRVKQKFALEVYSYCTSADSRELHS